MSRFNDLTDNNIFNNFIWNNQNSNLNRNENLSENSRSNYENDNRDYNNSDYNNRDYNNSENDLSDNDINDYNNRDYDYNYSSKDQKSEIKSKIIEEDLYIHFNSKDRNVLVDNMFDFSINFLSNNNGDASVNHSIKDILKIEIIELILPNFYINIKESLCLYDKAIITSNTDTNNSNNIRLKRLSDLPYIMLSIDDLSNNNYGTNNEINKSTFMLKYDDYKDISNKNSGFYTLNSDKYVEYGNINQSIVAETDKTMLNFKSIGDQSILFYPTPKGNMKNIRLSLKTPLGNTLSQLNEYIYIKRIDNISNKLLIEFTQYFSSEEYSLGDIILFKNFVSDTDTISDASHWRHYNLENFINRSNGHTIIGFYGQSENTPLSNTKLFNKIYIPFDYDLDLSTTTNATGRCTEKDTFGSSNTNFIGASGGFAINFSQQFLISLKVTVKRQIQSLE